MPQYSFSKQAQEENGEGTS